MPFLDTAALRSTLQTLFGAELVIERELGRGGMAAVFAAFDPGLQRAVAVKMLLPEIAHDSEVAERFLREGRTMASLHHPHVVAVYGVRSNRDANAIVMQFVDGRSLDALLAEQKALPLPVAGTILSQVAAGLQHAHDRGVVHRDVKPGNVLIDREGRAVVSDFGIARRNDGFATTKTGIVLGTSDYMSPEQRSGERVTTATDQYAFGIMAFEVLAGRLPFTGALGDVIRGHMSEAPPSLRSIRPEIPQAVESLVNRMLAKDPKERLSSLAEAAAVFGAITTVTGAASPWRVRTKGMVAAAVVLVGALGTWTVLQRQPGAERRLANGASLPVSVPSAAPLVNRATPDSVGAAQREPPNGANRSQGSSPGSSPGSSNMPGSGAGSAARSQRAAMPLATPSGSAPRDSSVVIPSRPRGAVIDSAKAPVVVGSDPARSSTTPAPTEPTAMAATLADARQLGRAFVTMLNQRRTRELAQLSAVGGDAVTRAELLKLTESAADFAAGFDRLPSAPNVWTSGFETELYLDLEWRGGKRIIRAHLFALRAAEGWRITGFGVEPSTE